MQAAIRHAPLRVALYSDCDSRAGVLTYTLTLSAALRRAGAQVTILTHQPADAAGAAIVDEMAASADRLIQLPAETHTARDAHQLAEAVCRVRADIFVPNYRQTPHAAAALCSRQGGSPRAIGICHNDHRSSYDVLHRYERCLSRLVCATDRTADRLAVRLPWRAGHIATIPHGVRTTAEACRPYEGGPIRLVYHGRLIEEQKRVSRLVECARRLSRAGVPFQLALIGDGPARAVCERAAAEPLLRGRLTVQGSQDWPALSARLSEGHVAVLASAYEGFCLSLAEAMAAGLPGVAHRCGGVIEQFLVHERTGLLADLDDLDGFVAAVARLQADPALWQRLSAGARALVAKRFSWEPAARRYLALFESALRDPAPPRWPLVRPAWVRPRGRTLGSIVERGGRQIGLWQ